MLESNQRLAVTDRGLDLRANPARCAVRELNPHLLGVGQLFWSVELPARQIGRGYRCRTCLAALIWRRSGYKPLPLTVSCLNWKWRERSSVKITERTYEKRAQALHRRRESNHPEATPLRQSASFRFV